MSARNQARARLRELPRLKLDRALAATICRMANEPRCDFYREVAYPGADGANF